MTWWPRRRGAPEAVLEHRYRRLLGWYPASYRAANEDEMLGAALAGAAPGQRRPGPGETASLVLGGLRERLRALPATLRSEAWQEAAAFTALAGPVLLAAICAGALIWQAVTYHSPLGGFGFLGIGGLASPGFLTPGGPGIGSLALAVGWSAAAAATLLRWRRTAAAAAGISLAADTALLSLAYSAGPWLLVDDWWQLILAGLAALSAITVLAGPGTARRPLSWPVTVAMIAAVAALAAAPAAETAFNTARALRGGATEISNPLFRIQGLLDYGPLALMGVVIMIAATRLRPPARRRVAVLALPVLSAAGLTGWVSGGFRVPGQQFTTPVLLTAPQWAALGAVPVLAFAAGLTLVSRHERALRRPRPAGGAGKTAG